MKNIDYEALKEILKSRLTPQRYYHSLCVMEEAEKLAPFLSADTEKAKLAGLLHDITKNTSTEEQFKIIEDANVTLTELERTSPKLHHAISGSCYVENELKLTDREIIDAIRYHTTARADMTPLDKVLYMADFISADRDYDGAEELRKLAYENFEEAMKVAVAFTVNELIEKRAQVHPDTVAAWNYEIQKGMK